MHFSAKSPGANGLNSFYINIVELYIFMHTVYILIIFIFINSRGLRNSPIYKYYSRVICDLPNPITRVSLNKINWLILSCIWTVGSGCLHLHIWPLLLVIILFHNNQMSYQYYCDMFFLMNGHYLDALVLVVLIQFNESFQAVSLENKGNVCYTSVSQFIDLESNK